MTQLTIARHPTRSQIATARGANQNIRDGTVPTLSRESAATDAGLSERQRKTALRVASVPEADFERQVESEIRARAWIRIGELSRELDASKGGKNPSATLPTGGKSKAAALKAASLSTSAAHR
ncbi:MAG: hypothetical protein ACREU3_03600 [Steroidobacteraceae bacterium]